jgi:hypothetical protein
MSPAPAPSIMPPAFLHLDEIRRTLGQQWAGLSNSGASQVAPGYQEECSRGDTRCRCFHRSPRWFVLNAGADIPIPNDPGATKPRADCLTLVGWHFRVVKAMIWSTALRRRSLINPPILLAIAGWAELGLVRKSDVKGACPSGTYPGASSSVGRSGALPCMSGGLRSL